MPSTVQYLDAIRAKHHVSSDAELARLLNVTKQTVSRYRLLPISMDDEIAMRAARLLNIRPATILLDMHAERQRNPLIKAAWQEAAETLREHAH
jgi:transcriptional regulator with XRE-family HTH domain